MKGIYLQQISKFYLNDFTGNNGMKYENLGPETEQVQFKRSTVEMKEGMISIASFLNNHFKLGSC